MSGALYGLGVGPGDPELLTVKAVRLMASGAVIAYPTTADGDSRARRIAASCIPSGAEELAFSLPVGADPVAVATAYDQAAQAIAARLDGGRDVAVLCEGDPFLYGSFMYLFDRLAERHPVTVVPGVTSLTASAAALGRPLAARNDVLAVVPAALDIDRLTSALCAAEAVAFVKVGRHFDKVRGLLRGLRLADRAFLVTAASCADETTADLDSLPDGAKPYFSTILVYKGSEPW